MYLKNSHLKSAIVTFVFVILNLSCLPPTETPSLLPENIPIQDAKVDPAFSTTEMRTIGLLPFSNAVQYDDAYVIYNNLIDKFTSKHSQYQLIPPSEIMSIIASSGLSDDFNVFLGDFANTGVANPSFLNKLKEIVKVDSVLFGKILAMGPYSYKEKHVGPITGKVWYETVDVNRVGIHLACYRGKDGRKIWDGKHILSEKSDLSTLANTISVIFANYFGRKKY